MGPALARQGLSVEAFLARGGEEREELIGGMVVEKAAPTGEHSRAQGGVDRRVGFKFDRKPGGRWPGGWWFFVEADVRLGSDVLRPDLCGYRRDRHGQRPAGFPLAAPPDWVCEILSPSTARTDRVEKLQAYFASGVEHYWLIDPLEGGLEVFRRTDLAYALVQSARRGQRLRPEPFQVLEFSVDELLGEDADDEP
jgi:Uma2 family endonuclease